MTAPSAAMPVPPADRRPPAEIRRRGGFEIRWRAPRPVVRAVVSSLAVAIVLGVVFLAYDVALDLGAVLPGGDLRVGLLAAYVGIVVVVGSVVTWLIVPLPTGPGAARTTRTPWSAALGLLAAVPIAYLVLVVLHEIVKPLLVRP
jgi:hypothetical protein